ncbi:hypothetical protein MUP59_04335 [Candidatus Bathyarchaeota archaeon]|nr:hypothetical protein [Candidatus Bathyarchaeota archaeon]
MKVSLKPHEVQDALYRTLSKVGDLYELKITVTPKGQEAFNIAIGFEADELTQLVNEAGTLKGYYAEKVRQVTSMLLLMLDKALTNLENKHKTGSPYWKRLRVRKRLVQTILSVAGEDDWKKRIEELAAEFFQSSDKDLLTKEESQ